MPARKRKAPRKGRKGGGKATARRRRTPKRTTPRRAKPLVTKMRELDRAVERIGRDRLKAGPVRIGKTRKLTAGKRGQAAFRKLIAAASGSKAIKTFSYSVTLREGKTTVKRPRRVVPDLRLMRKGKKESWVHFRKRVEAKVMRDLQKEIFANVTDSGGRARERKITTRKGVTRRLRQYAEGKAVTFEVELFAEV